MTSHFDNLMGIMRRAIDDPETYREIANWLADICIKQADDKEENWNFETWKKSENPYAKLYKDSEFHLKMHFLNDCHGVLDHKNWHLRVFNRETAHLIRTIADAVVENRNDIYDVNKLQKQFQELPEFLTKLGYKQLDKRGWMWGKQEE